MFNQGDRGLSWRVWVDPLGLSLDLSNPTSNSPFYSVLNTNGGDVWLSTVEIRQSDFAGLVNGHPGNVNILTGTHGDRSGNLIPHEGFFDEDMAQWGNTKNVKVMDVTKMDQDKVSKVVNSGDRTICAWCWSERSKLVKSTLKK